MIIVHDIFVCKPGNASKLAKQFKDLFGSTKEFVNILTDVTGSFNKVVIITKYDSLSAYEKSRENMDPAEMKRMQEGMKGHTDLYLTGSREIYKVW